MEQAPLVSIVCITYNQAEYIGQCLDSMLQQQVDFTFEIILGEDESADGTREICQSYAERYPGIIRLALHSRKDVICIDGKATGRHNFMESIRLARGKYIAICEGDDYWTDPFKLEKQVRFLEENPAYILCFTRGIIKNTFQNTESVNAEHATFRELQIGDFIRANEQLFATTVYRNEPVVVLPPWFAKARFGDIALYIWLLHHSGKKAACLSDITAVYRLHASGIHGYLHASGPTLVQAYRKELAFYGDLKKMILPGAYRLQVNNALAAKLVRITGICCRERLYRHGLSINLQYLFRGLPLKTFCSNILKLQKFYLRSVFHGI